MTDSRARVLGTVEDIHGDELEVAVVWDADPDPDPDDGYPAVEVAGHSLDQDATEALALLVAAAREAAPGCTSPAGEEATADA